MVSNCRCVSCAGCLGTGVVEVATGTYPEWDLDTCPDCGGSGYSETCEDHEHEDYE